MPTRPNRKTVSLADYPDLVMILLGFRVGSLRALPSLLRIGRGLGTIARQPPDGLLQHDGILFAWNHVGIRQYWRDPDTLAAFTRSMPHSGWWRDFLADAQGAGFWHEAYHARGGVEAIYVGMPQAIGLGAFAPEASAAGAFMTAAGRHRHDAALRAGGAP